MVPENPTLLVKALSNTTLCLKYISKLYFYKNGNLTVLLGNKIENLNFSEKFLVPRVHINPRYS